MQTALEARRVSGSLLRLASMGLLAICACRGTPLAQPGRSFDDSRTSLKAGTVSQEDAERIEEHRLAARAGDPKARTLLGLMYQTGQGVPRNEIESARWFRRAAEQDECAGEYHLGLLYLQGAGVPVDIERAAYWLRRAADHDLDVQRSSFESLYAGILELAGSIGRGPESLDDTSSAHAAEEPVRNVASLYRRGLAYQRGDGAPVDRAHAVRLFRMAAGEGHAEAQLELGLAYATGRGARLDPIRAHQWLNIASAAGSRRARVELAELASELSEEQIAEAEFLALEWLRRRESVDAPAPQRR